MEAILTTKVPALTIHSTSISSTTTMLMILLMMVIHKRVAVRFLTNIRICEMKTSQRRLRLNNGMYGSEGVGV